MDGLASCVFSTVFADETLRHDCRDFHSQTARQTAEIFISFTCIVTSWRFIFVNALYFLIRRGSPELHFYQNALCCQQHHERREPCSAGNYIAFHGLFEENISTWESPAALRLCHLVGYNNPWLASFCLCTPMVESELIRIKPSIWRRWQINLLSQYMPNAVIAP